MNENQVMISAAMLEAMWQSRKKDMLDLITPFIVFAVAQNNSVGEEIDTKKSLAIRSGTLWICGYAGVHC